ncbi:unnamed protein product [Clonostachys rosea f. rosea IK726]|uniref:Uncharacterized protein n=1 Tax=Clonostachys rosea f. rosea IK726 TaxID=1349383 RepID=A0ACA9UPV2_BIOOC|nr:unnamed protein product [Clonostachys rosea f. rosea IK726]
MFNITNLRLPIRILLGCSFVWIIFRGYLHYVPVEAFWDSDAGGHCAIEDDDVFSNPVRSLEKWTDDTWREFIRSWLGDTKHVSVLGKPSLALAEKMKAEEKARVEARKKELGEDGIKKLGDRLESAKSHNDAPIPPAVLECPENRLYSFY